MQITFAKTGLPKAGAVLVPVFEDGGREGAFAALDAATEGALSRAAKAAAFTGRKDQAIELLAPSGVGLSRVVVLGAGKGETFGALEAEALGGAAAMRLAREKSAAILLDGFDAKTLSADDLAARVGVGARLRGYRFDKYRTRLEKDQKPALEKLAIHTASTKAKTLFADLDHVATGVALTRDLVSEPPNVLHPESFAARARELESLGVKVTVLGEAQMKKLGMGALLGVGQGSARESQLVALEWMGGPKGGAPVAFVGKGVTFDTGGISIKPAQNMEDMKWDMGGAGAVTGLIAALAGRKAKVNAVGVLGLVENMPDGAAQRPGDIVKTMSGQTVEIINTDAEGRLVLADAIWWTQEIYKPKVVVDLATLTGAIIVALANEYAGLFTRDDALAAELSAAGAATGEKLWRMPLDKAHDEMIKSDVADMKNTGGRDGGSSSAAAFIGRFVKEGQAWAHLDIAGKAWTTKDLATTPKGGTGYGVRLLDAWVRARFEK